MCIRDSAQDDQFGPLQVEQRRLQAGQQAVVRHPVRKFRGVIRSSQCHACLLYTSDAADERSSVDLGGRRIIKQKKQNNLWKSPIH